MNCLFFTTVSKPICTFQCPCPGLRTAADGTEAAAAAVKLRALREACLRQAERRLTCRRLGGRSRVKPVPPPPPLGDANESELATSGHTARDRTRDQAIASRARCQVCRTICWTESLSARPRCLLRFAQAGLRRVAAAAARRLGYQAGAKLGLLKEVGYCALLVHDSAGDAAVIAHCAAGASATENACDRRTQSQNRARLRALQLHRGLVRCTQNRAPYKPNANSKPCARGPAR
jgi:hypothetical protein